MVVRIGKKLHRPKHIPKFRKISLKNFIKLRNERYSSLPVNRRVHGAGSWRLRFNGRNHKDT